jgi:hypothetical protein
MATYGANTNIDNERKYLNNLISGGGGNAEWAKNQLKVLEAFAASQPKDTTSTSTNKTKKKTTTSKTTKPTTPTYNEHQQYIQDVHPGGYDAYIQLQNDRYNTALQNNDVDLLRRLQEDSQRVGYSLTPNYQVQPVTPQIPEIPDFSKEISDLYSAMKNYQPQMPNIPYPDMKNYNFGDIQNQLNALTSQVQNYQGADYMSMDEAIARANSQLSGMYNQALEQALEQYNKNAISRGMFGQLPVEALKAQAISESELDKANAINALGANLYSQDFDMAQRENQNYYQQINKLADLLGQQYNTELGRYQSDLNRYNTLYNQARQADQDYFNNIARQLDLLETQYNMQNREIDRYVQNIGQFSNDYMAEILKLQNDNDPSNDWKIAYLQNARNQKIAGMNEAEAKSQSELYKQAMDMFSKLGYATGWVAQALGLPEGTTTATYARLNTGGGSGSSGSSGSKSPDLNLQELTQQARLIASSMYPKGYTQTQLNDIINTLYEFWETGDTKVLNKIKNHTNINYLHVPSRSPDTNANQYDMEIFDWLQQ